MLADKFNLLGKSPGEALQIAETVVRQALADRAERGMNYLKNWEMYRGRHEPYFKRRLDEPDNIFAYRKKNAIKNNLCGFTVDLSAKYLYGKASKVIRNFSKNKITDASVRDLVKKFYLAPFMLDSAKKTAVFGEIVVRLVPVDFETGLQVTGVTNETTYPQPIVMDPMRTFMVSNKWGRLAAIFSQYQSIDYATQQKTVVSELVVSDSRWVWEAKGSLDTLFINPFIGFGERVALTAGTLVSSGANPYRLTDEFILFKNNEDRTSDLDEIMDLNISLDEALTDKQHFFAKHGWPQLVTEVNLENVTYSPNKIWEITPDLDDKKKVLDRLGFLTWDGKMADHAAFVKNLERTIMIISQTAQISTGDLESIGQLRSGAALITAHSVAIHKTEAKQITWNQNELMFYEALTCMDSYFHNEDVKGRYPDLDPDIRFPRDFVPGAELERVNIQKAQIDSHFVPLYDVIEENYGNIGEDEINKKRDQILQDSRDIADTVREVISETGGATTGVSGSSGSPMQKSQEQKSGIN